MSRVTVTENVNILLDQLRREDLLQLFLIGFFFFLFMLTHGLE